MVGKITALLSKKKGRRGKHPGKARRSSLLPPAPQNNRFDEGINIRGQAKPVEMGERGVVLLERMKLVLRKVKLRLRPEKVPFC